MARIPKYTLEKDERKDRWELQQDSNGKVVRTFDTKEEATARGVLKRAVGKEGGSVRIQKENGRFQEERTFPRSRDPRSSKG